MAEYTKLDRDLTKLESVARIIGELLIDETAKEWRAQGHNLTGDYINSLEQVVSRFTDSVVLEVYGNIYGNYLEAGVSADRIPYGGKTNFAGFKVVGVKSAYITALINYVKARHMTAAGEKKERQIAFAIAAKHKKEGMPTKASARFSETGQRTKYIDAILRRNEARVEKLAADNIEGTLNIALNNIALQYNITQNT